jgi:hypothetical protein
MKSIPLAAIVLLTCDLTGCATGQGPSASNGRLVQPATMAAAESSAPSGLASPGGSSGVLAAASAPDAVAQSRVQSSANSLGKLSGAGGAPSPADVKVGRPIEFREVTFDDFKTQSIQPYAGQGQYLIYPIKEKDGVFGTMKLKRDEDVWKMWEARGKTSGLTQAYIQAIKSVSGTGTSTTQPAKVPVILHLVGGQEDKYLLWLETDKDSKFQLVNFSADPSVAASFYDKRDVLKALAATQHEQ